MAKNDKNNSKVPGAAIAIVAVIIAVTVFVPTVYMPYKNKKPAMDSEHQEAVNTINYYETSIQNQATIEADIEQLEKEWEEFQKDMFVDAASSIDDLQKAMDDIDFHYTEFKRDSEKEDKSGKVSFTGAPLYYVSIKIKGVADEEQLVDLLKFVEEESVGCYYVKTLKATTYDTDKEIGTFTAKAGQLDVNMEIWLYYYNQKVPAVLPDSDSDSATDSAK